MKSATAPNAGLRIAAICATPAKLNTGMRLVDLTLKRILESLGLLQNTEFFCFEPPVLLDANRHEIHYRSVLDMDSALAYDAIIIWGDFVTSLKYIESKATTMSGQRATPRVAVRDALLRQVLLRDLSAEALSKVIVFGQNLFLDKRAIFTDEPYFTALRKLLIHARVARLRDPISAYCASAITGLPPGRFAGVDAALLMGLLEPPSAGQTGSTGRVGLFFDRTSGSLTTRATLGLAMRLVGGLQPIWIPWFPALKTPSLLNRVLFGIRQSAHPVELADYLAEVRRCRFIITDAYHLCVTAWSQGVPAIAIGRGAQKFKSTVSDKKKEILYLSNHLDEMYLFSESPFTNILRWRIPKALALAMDPSLGPDVRSRMLVMAKENLDLVSTALVDILGIRSAPVLNHGPTDRRP